MTLDDFMAIRASASNRPISGGCWIWPLSTLTSGYGQVWIGRKMHRTHRLSWSVDNGPIPDGLFICHRCDNPRCINPAHLYAGTPASNTSDMISRKRAGHQKNPNAWSLASSRSGRMNTWSRGSGNPKAKLTEEQVRSIRASKEQTRILALHYGVDRTIVQRIRSGKLWPALDAASSRAA